MDQPIIITASGHLDLYDPERPAAAVLVSINGKIPMPIDGGTRKVDESEKRLELAVRTPSNPGVDAQDQWGNPLRIVAAAKEILIYVPACWLVDADAKIERLEREVGHYQRILRSVADAIAEAQ